MYLHMDAMLIVTYWMKYEENMKENKAFFFFLKNIPLVYWILPSI